MNTLLKTGIGSTLATLAVAALSASTSATTITFDPIGTNPVGLPLNNPYIEGEFTYQSVSNTGGNFGSSLFGNPDPALTVYLGPETLDTIAIEFVRTDGGLFTFDSFDAVFLGDPGGLSNGWTFFGEVGGNPTQFFGFATSSTSFTTEIPTTFTTPIDRLVIQFSQENDLSLIVDNLVLTPVSQSVPEPGTILGLLAVGALGALSRKRKG
ncbi:PEP-CTERM sorting domain-containing protein [Crocosphaera sp. XPORK-15E]|uniref:PEP-CTERM sorting domain-containing protein n=1 Tax=Crocosphaera sp. XPORK-15E TaxID=3110247 RepID=UPI002B1F4975|nr:PEP-CTERM sorting domain-containing protein [Crocosphaera sp. XPORK-15E]MEA5535640.1 PEP-CTERM sorting domain-containing protein [Crocosphaera sp. XPORK-15E]